MSFGYQLAYRVGITPWENAGRAASAHFTALLDREEQERSRPLGRALDLGCGTGLHTIELAERGWDATGLDAVGHAIAKAEHRPGADRARFVVGDVTDLGASGLDGDVDFFLDVGCFHGLDDGQRAAMGRGVTTLSSPTATLLMLAFQPSGRPLLPRGASRTDIERAFPGWQVVASEDADTSGMPGPLKKTAPAWHRLRRLG